MVQALGIDRWETGGLRKLLERLHPARQGLFGRGGISQRTEQRLRLQEPEVALPQARQIGGPVPA